ncbi:MAG TPA: C40 family peptidase [Gaiellaceae bacterium]|nr:C40 family peptidase [Gaiellaceae bacterium]
MRPLRFLLLLLALAFTLALALLRPLPGRADTAPGPSEPAATGTEDPPLLPPPPGVSVEQLTKPAATRHLASARHLSASLRFGKRVVKYAKHLVGVPYRYGGSSPRTGFDCSGFVRYVYSHFGVSLPHSSYADINRGRSVKRWQLHPGDILFFDNLGHVGIYVGKGHFIHAPHSGTVVRIETLAGWYSQRYDGARRIR